MGLGITGDGEDTGAGSGEGRGEGCGEGRGDGLADGCGDGIGLGPGATVDPCLPPSFTFSISHSSTRFSRPERIPISSSNPSNSSHVKLPSKLLRKTRMGFQLQLVQLKNSERKIF